ncbi:hypothetical protein, conserved [Trypanosoma brucei gambiense DAL972]|uniref:Rhodanese domain-containing protein n=1 Tax=Trypanosoma brucei gambiense (strain MHOM/CI/86/DAL972) TaxID=679716 RepID=D0A9P9_TRYB9|nr:hypothetical protein, conserved [Trypanosoma brucei gambiense DAL972]CBH18400.1 hypothetical protein, conserved [Trypanosoma brucei gambiense DAL972]|eukprot:XP_011780664.1 hypothetical protein, conserved [Trypanosoma brucei gambiense DAL972]
MGQSTSYEELDRKRALNKFHMAALLKSKRSGKNENTFIVDVRDAFEVKRYGTIPFSVHIPSSEVRSAFRMSPTAFETKYKIRMPQASDKIVFFDQRHGRAATAVDVVEALGYRAATYFADGYNEWSKFTQGEQEEDL